MKLIAISKIENNTKIMSVWGQQEYSLLLQYCVY